MGSWRAVALPRVDHGSVADALVGLHTSWADASHVTATTTLAGAVRGTGVVGLPLATLMDLVVMPGLPGTMALPVEGFPGPAVFRRGVATYEDAMTRWQEQASGRRLRIGIQVDDSLRAFVRAEADVATGRALVASRREYARTVHALVAAGVDPGSFRPRDELAQVAARAWARAEQDVPALGAPRDLVWVDFDDIQGGATADARHLAQRVRGALAAAFGAKERWTLVHHGFYFFTPPQWALFQVLKRIPEVDQVFVVHDDSSNPAFATWRHYFRSEFGMPPVDVRTGEGAVTPAAAVFRAVLEGEATSVAADIEVRDCGSPVELVRLFKDEDTAVTEGDPGPLRYAASADEVQRFAQRLGRSGTLPSPRLAQLPVGSFLMSLHGCIRQGSDGRTSVDLTGQALLDMVASGFLDLPAGVTGAGPATLRRTLPYFGGCRTGEQWTERAELLRRTVEERVAEVGVREDDESDVERVARAAANPTRLVPWADVTLDEVAAVQATVRRAVDLVEETAARERVTLGDHLGQVRARLERALRRLPEKEREVIEAKLRGFGVALEDEIDVVGLVDVVAMLLGRSADFEPDLDSERPGSASTSVSQLRGLDALGLQRADTDVHLANLAENVFPGQVSAVGWPFDLEDLRTSDEAVDPVTVDLLELRAATASLSDLYLFWLALDGVEPGRKVRLSWLSDVAGEKQRLSPIVSLLTRPDVRSDAVKAVAGGLEVQPVRSAADMLARRERPSPVVVDVDPSDVTDVLDALDTRASTAAMVCPRRFAIQWAMGPTAAFGPEYLQTMLLGNVNGALVKADLMNPLTAAATTNQLWAHLTEGQRASSREKSVVKASGGSADVAWLTTLAGNAKGSKAMDRAYQAAMDEVSPEEEEIAPEGPVFLPVGVDDPEVCGKCPVQARCNQWTAARR